MSGFKYVKEGSKYDWIMPGWTSDYGRVLNMPVQSFTGFWICEWY